MGGSHENPLANIRKPDPEGWRAALKVWRQGLMEKMNLKVMQEVNEKGLVWVLYGRRLGG